MPANLNLSGVAKKISHFESVRPFAAAPYGSRITSVHSKFYRNSNPLISMHDTLFANPPPRPIKVGSAQPIYKWTVKNLVTEESNGYSSLFRPINRNFYMHVTRLGWWPGSEHSATSCLRYLKPIIRVKINCNPKYIKG